MRTPAVKSDLKRRKEVAELKAQMAAEQAAEIATKKEEEAAAVKMFENLDEDKYHKALFPSIAPLKAAMYFGQDADQLGRWRLFISGRACAYFYQGVEAFLIWFVVRDIRQLDKESMQNVLSKLIRDLSKGHFSNVSLALFRWT